MTIKTIDCDLANTLVEMANNYYYEWEDLMDLAVKYPDPLKSKILSFVWVLEKNEKLLKGAGNTIIEQQKTIETLEAIVEHYKKIEI